ncbi:hypothetical protein [Pedobacter sandarakinus]|uniref:hypothetical protein n=1 Tax=Pedobacter sandarakinus TaxID=353156 RepID=UPI002245B357|nr:hypothetical protein [Pedobacter sandarakinus]MCX2573587.1 hypothetical protein [Pedobacter sandarakinus]
MSTAFQNKTIQVVKGKTTAFLTTYYPDKEWIDNWRIKRKTAFKGNIVFNRINLSDEGLSMGSVANGQFSTDGNGLKGKMLATVGNGDGFSGVISLLPGECEFIDVYTVVARACSTGDMPGSCPWEKEGLTLAEVQKIHGSGAHLPYYTLERSNEVNCAAPEIPTAPSGGGGGGSTTPAPPTEYNPCSSGPQEVGEINYERGTRLMAAPPTPCDGGGTGGGTGTPSTNPKLNTINN